MSETPETVSAWARQTFGPISGPDSIAARANKEMAELLAKCVLEPDNLDAIIEETADVIICLYRMVECGDVDLFEAIDRKMAVNRARKWIVKNGHGQHVEAPQ